MNITTGIIPRELGSSPARIPLQIRTTSPSPTSTLKAVRRKDSFLRRADSSEDYPSPHESIFEAFYFSASNSDESNSRIELITLYPHGISNDENRGPLTPTAPCSIEDVQFRYGHGTVLETIVEQKTGRTNRTVSRAKSMDNMPNFPFLSHRDSFVLTKSPRRKRSFSLDDLALVNRYYHDACSTIEKETCKPLPLFAPEIYAQPKKPLHAPPNRPPTPPGMPSWTAAQNIPARGRLVYAPARQGRFQRFFGLPASGITVTSRIPTSNGLVPSGERVVSAPVIGRIAPRFRPPRSVYGPLDQHPFSRAPVACAVTGDPPSTTQAEFPTAPHANLEPGIAELRRQKSRRRRLLGNRVRFTPSATARDSETLALQSAIEASSASAVHPLSPLQELLQPAAAPSSGYCQHHRSKLQRKSQMLGNGSPRNSTPLGTNYANIPSSSPTRSDHTPIMGPRQSLSPTTSRFTSSTNSPYLHVPLDFGDISITPTSTPILEIDSRVSSAHSTAPLMPGALHRSLMSTPELARQHSVVPEMTNDSRPNFCWRCKVDQGFRMVDEWWMNSMSFICFVCCGYDVDEDENVRYTSALRADEQSPSPRRQHVGSRRVALDRVSGRY